jgi:acylglycerol lipase
VCPGYCGEHDLGAWLLAARLLLLLVLLCATAGDVSLANIIKTDLSADIGQTGVPFYEWQDDSVKSPKWVVVALHGAAQQGGAMEALCAHLASYGCLAIAPDLRGAGRWPSLMKQRPTSAFNDFVMSCDDLLALLKRMKKEYPKARIFCIGESAGATVVLNAMTRDSSHIKGIVLCSAGTRPKMHNPATMGPEFYKQLLHVTRPVDMSNFIGHYASDDPRTRQEMINDPLGRNKETALELVGTFNFIQQGNLLATEMPKSLPVLVMQGTDDQIIEPKSANHLFDELRVTDKKFVEIPQCGHILIGTSYLKPVVVSTILEWLSEHGGPKVPINGAASISASALVSGSASGSASASVSRRSAERLIDPQAFSSPPP